MSRAAPPSSRDAEEMERSVTAFAPFLDRGRIVTATEFDWKRFVFMRYYAGGFMPWTSVSWAVRDNQLKLMEKTMMHFTLLFFVALLIGADRLAVQEKVEARGIAISGQQRYIVW
jgi:hypothetical protein